jgi:homoserine kinase
LGRSVEDVVIEPQRKQLIPGYEDVKSAAMASGALACTISGAGPTLFAMAKSEKVADRIGNAMVRSWNKQDVEAEYIVTTISDTGASVLP